MNYGLFDHKTNLDHEPIPFCSFNSSVDWHTLGDIHGNALYLLHFLLNHGLARFRPDVLPLDEDIKLLGLPFLKPRTYYQFFWEIYHKPLNFWTKKNIVLAHRALEYLEIADGAHIRLLGDILCDRGENDYFTWKVLERIAVQKKARFEIILSNHDMEFINRHEKGGDDPYSDGNHYCMSNVYKNVALKQTVSLLNMNHLINQGILSHGEIKRLYSRYKTSLKLLSYDQDANGRLVIYSHAPINEIDILRVALCLVDKRNIDIIGDCLSQSDKSYLHRIKIFHPSDVYDAKLTNEDLLTLIDILNRFTSHMAQQDRLTELMTMRLSEHPDSAFGDGYGRATQHESFYPFKMLFWGTTDPNLRKLNSKIQSICSFTNTHGHTSSDFGSHQCLNGNFGRPTFHQGSYSFCVSRSQESPRYVPSPRNYAIAAAGAILFLGIVSLVVARVCTGEISAFFALGSFKISGKTIQGLLHMGVVLASTATFFLLKPSAQANIIEPKTNLKRPGFVEEFVRSCV